MDINDKLNNILNNEKINKVDYDELKFVAKYTNCNEKIIRWFIMIQKYDINGWRDSNIVKSICETFLKNEKIKFYSLFCPSYLKGENLFGFRTDDIGFTSKNGIKMLSKIKKETEKIGFKCEKNEAIFFDLALEQPEKNNTFNK